MAILAAGVGFAIRGGIFDNWGGEYGFTGAQLGAIGGAGFTGFCFGIILGGVVADKIGYGKLVILAFATHMLSYLVTFMASSPDNAYTFLFWGMFLFAYANGTLEAVANPLVATLFPEKRTHYLNILHASWPAGLVIGGIIGWTLDDKLEWGWKYQLALYLIPVVAYGLMFMGQKMPRSEASEKGMKLGDMFKDVGILGGFVICALLAMFFGGMFTGLLTGADATVEEAAKAAKTGSIIGYLIGFALLVVIGVITRFALGSVLLFVLFVVHALVGAVELGTDQWSQNITGNLFTSEQGKWLFIWTSAIMFALRFCAEWIERVLKLSPIALLFVCAVLASIGLHLAGGMTTVMMAFGALGVYAIGKTFFWPTMLAVASDRFPRTGAVAISIMGGIGMMSAGLIGSPGLGYLKDRYAGAELEKVDTEVFEEYKAEKPSRFLNMKWTETAALDGTKLQEAKDSVTAARADEQEPDATALMVVESDQRGDRATLRTDALIPAAMAVIYLLLMLYFKTIGGYKVIHIEEKESGSGGEG
ncbi:MAG: MFS transporter [Roseibacillus sp.]